MNRPQPRIPTALALGVRQQIACDFCGTTFSIGGRSVFASPYAATEAAIIPTVSTKENYTIDCYVDEEGLLKQLPLNERLTAFARPVYKLPLVGNAVFAAHDAEGETVGLSKADADAIVALFNGEI